MSTDVDPSVGAPEKTRQRILDAAADEFMLGGYNATTIDDIANAVGATKGLIYYHFRSKFDIFLAVYKEGMVRSRARVDPCVDGPGTGFDRLLAMSTAHVLQIMVDLGYHQVVHEGVREQRSVALRPRQREQLAELNRLRAEYEDLFKSVAAAGIEDGSIRPLEPKMLVRTLLSSLNAVDMWYRPNPDQSESDLAELAAQVTDIVVSGIDRRP
ncbi:transcriptional regulator, TetR family [Brevibacterium sp. 239c]|uniref:TetR/AcrR family transcriptional regulator n=1 Tax=Brevibacterium sp. 239c TaxID=1965356 RepID=UPI000C3C901D|nr:TetR/AcrR family transcriptional regulator [Brevibacterium sp. 239c]SMX90800.1 transcriptional regulator, TetR family [Brevibacterium sp. 239c]